MIGLAAEDLADLRRWAICGAVVVLAHGGIATAMVTWREPIEGTGAAAGIVIEFAPVPVAPATVQSEVPPGPEADITDSSPTKQVDSPEEKKKTEEQIEEPPPEVPPAPNPEVAIQPPPKEVKKERPQPQEQRPEAVATAPQVIAEQISAVPAAPRPGAPNPYDSNAARTWNAQIHAVILRNKRYPASARSRGQTGMTRVAFTLDRQGRVVDSRVTSSSGVAALDEEALALLRRAQPFPAPPPEFPDDRVTLNLPLNFDLK
jgi:periplasmic protein TonB